MNQFFHPIVVGQTENRQSTRILFSPLNSATSLDRVFMNCAYFLGDFSWVVLIKAAKWSIEEPTDLMLLVFKKFKTTVRANPGEVQELSASSAPSQRRVLSHRVDSKAA